MLGTGLGVLVSSQIGADWSSVAMGCLALSAVHLSCTYRSLTHVVQTTVSIKVCEMISVSFTLSDGDFYVRFQRFEALVQGFIENGRILSPEDIACK